MNGGMGPRVPWLTRLLSPRTLWRRVFWSYAVLLFIGTHWPNLRVTIPRIERPDLLTHFALFGTWAGLFWASAYAGSPLKLKTLVPVTVIACLYAGIDEGLQAVPIIQRNAAWDDYAANCLGVLLAVLVIAGLVGWTNRAWRDAAQNSHAVQND